MVLSLKYCLLQPLGPSQISIPVHAIPPLHVQVSVPVQSLLFWQAGEHTGFTKILIAVHDTVL